MFRALWVITKKCGFLASHPDKFKWIQGNNGVTSITTTFHLLPRPLSPGSLQGINPNESSYSYLLWCGWWRILCSSSFVFLYPRLGFEEMVDIQSANARVLINMPITGVGAEYISEKNHSKWNLRSTGVRQVVNMVKLILEVDICHKTHTHKHTQNNQNSVFWSCT